MRRLYYLFIVMILIVSCNDKDETVPVNENQNKGTLLAGDHIGEDIFYTIVEDIHINITRTDSSAYLYGNSQLIDLKNDYKSDLFLHVISIGVIDEYSTTCYFNTYDNIEICLAENDTSNIKLLQEGDTIGNIGNWQGTLDKKYYLASYYYKNQKSSLAIDSTTGLWNDVVGGYMAIREMKENDTTYGWIEIDLTGRYDLMIKRYAIQK